MTMYALDADDIAEVTAMASQGLTQTQIANALWVCQGTVSNFIRRHQIPYTSQQRKGAPRKYDHAVILRCRDQGLSQKETAAKVGCTAPLVCKVWGQAK